MSRETRAGCYEIPGYRITERLAAVMDQAIRDLDLHGRLAARTRVDPAAVEAVPCEKTTGPPTCGQTKEKTR